MVLVSLVLALAATSDSAVTVGECQGHYNVEYFEQWELPKEGWDSDCALGREPREVLRLRQLAFQQECRKAFANQPNVAPGLVDAFCAQGVPGRRRLRAQLGMPAEGLPPSAIGAASDTPKPSAPGEQGMGPLADSIEAAKGRWGPNLCMNAMIYYSRHRAFNVEASRDPSKSDLKPHMGQVEAYYYYFSVPSRRLASPVIAYYDVVDSAFCMITDRMRGPDFDEAVKNTGDDCLGNVDVDVKQAIGLAAKENFNASERLEAYLLSPGSWGFLYDRCERGIRFGMGKWCDKLLTKTQLKQLRRKDVWVLYNGDTQLFIDAHKPRVLFKTDANIHMIPFRETGRGLMSPAACDGRFKD